MRTYSVVRLLLGLFLIVNAPVGTFFHPPPLGNPGDLLMGALWDSPFIMVLAKLTELGVGALLVSNRFVPLALTLFAPVLTNIFLFHVFYAHPFLPVGAAMVAATVFLAWHHRAAYRQFFRPVAA